jgi:hypothetical protein
MTSGDPPFFSILVPVKGRAELARDALASVLRQEMDDIEVVVSNNGADPAVRDALAPLIGDARVRSVEQPVVLDMPTHWERLAAMATGRYLTVLPDRSLLVRGALARIRAIHAEHPAAADIVSWQYKLFHDGPGLLQSLAGDGAVRTVASDEAMVASVSDSGALPYALPRGLNSSVSMALVREIRAREGAAFLKINPDFTFAYQCLVRRPAFAHVDAALMISQGLSVSNGANSVFRDARGYLASLGLPDTPVRTPIRGALNENVILEDFLAVCESHGRADLIERWDRAAYFARCLAEIATKRAGGVADPDYVALLAAEYDRALAAETPAVRAAVAARTGSGRARLDAMRLILRRLLGERAARATRPMRLRLKGARRYASALEAAGFGAQP